MIVLAAAGAAAQNTPADPLRPSWCRDLPRAAYKNLERVVSTQDWFEVYRIRPGVFAIYEPKQYEEVISYVIVGSAKALLFDTGMGIGKMRRVVEGLTAKPVTVLNSHAHHDHVGGNAEFERAMGMDNAFSRKNAEGRRGLGPEVLKADRICGALPAGVTTESYVIGPWTISEIVRDGSRIALGGREVEVIATPGHTPDSLCLYDAKNRLLFTGDTFYPGPIYLFGGETNLADYANSSDRLAKLAPQVNLLLPGHNVPVAEPRNLSRLAAAIKQVRSGQGTPKNNGGLREYQFDGFSILTR